MARLRLPVAASDARTSGSILERAAGGHLGFVNECLHASFRGLFLDER